MNFADKIRALSGISFDAVLDTAASFVPREDWSIAWKRLQSGKTVLEDEDALNCYLISYGEMHRVKLLAFIPDSLRRCNFSVSGVSIVDWGCGQGLATSVLLDYLLKNGGVDVKSVRLIEMSNAARNRAKVIVSKYPRVSDVLDIPWVPGKAIDGAALGLPDGVPVIHLFSNILDVEAIDLKMVCEAVNETRKNGAAHVITVGIRKGRDRVRAFWSLLGNPELLHEQEGRLLVRGRINTSCPGCSCFGLSYSLARIYAPRPSPRLTQRPARPQPAVPAEIPAEKAGPITPVVVQEPITEPTVAAPARPGKFTRVFSPGYATSAIFDFARTKPEWCAYEFSTVDDSLLYNINLDDIAPFYAVVNNLIVRGRPSFASILVEDELIHRIGYTKSVEDRYGAIHYEVDNESVSNEDLAEWLLGIDPARQDTSENDGEVKARLLALVPLMVARVQHAIMRGFMGGRFDKCEGTIKVLAIERDVPCVRLALRDLEETFSYLTKVCRDGERGSGEVKFDIDVVALNSRYSEAWRRNESSDTAVGELADEYKLKRYDAVIDVSFFHDPDAKDIFDQLGFIPRYTARVRTAFQVTEKDYLFQICTAENIEYRPMLHKDPEGVVTKTEAVEGLRFFLRNVFRKLDFRDGQLPILDRALRCKSVIGLLPTGGGKSLTYQLATMMQPGIALVVDPLQSLMKDQVDGLLKVGIDVCQYINATLKGRELEDALNRTTSGNCKFIFVSPERLSIPSYRYVLGEMYANGLYFSYGIIDEVHCVSEWGHDFRPFYLHLGRNLHDYARVKGSIDENGRTVKYIPLFGLTATASFDVLSDVQRELSGRNAEELESDAIVRYENTNRLELQYRVVAVANPNAKEYQARIDNVKRQIERLDRQIAEETEQINRGTALPGLKVILQGHKAEKEALEEGAPGRQSIKSAKGELSRYANGCKLQVINGSLREQELLFREILKPENVKMIKERFLEREEIKEKSPYYRKVMDADLDVSFSTQDWTVESPDGGYSQAGLVFCPYKGFSTDSDRRRRGPSPISVEGVYSSLVEQYGQAVRHFTSSIAGNAAFEQQRWANQQEFINNQAGLMIATSAFGMGIDKPNIRFVVEINHPISLESFVQEAGRAGRDRKMAIATLLLSDTDDVDLDVQRFFHKKSFLGIRPEKKELVNLFDKKEFKREETSTSAEGIVNGFLAELLQANPGDVRIYLIKVPPTEDEKGLLDKLIYRLCCIGVIDDVECMYGADSRYRLKMVRRTEEEYYETLRSFLRRYYTAERAAQEVEKAKGMRGENVIHKCVAYLTDFVYKNVERKRERALQDMHAFCKEGCRPLRTLPNGRKETWLDVNEDLKDWIYFYFNSKYARSGNVVKIGDREESFSLVDDTDHGKVSSFEIVAKYMRVIDDELLENNSPKDNVKHLQGAVRLVRRAALETNPSLSLLNAFCLCYLGFRGNKALVEECVRSISIDGFVELIRRGEMSSCDIWDRFRWFSQQLREKARDLPKDELDEIMTRAMLDIHLDCTRKLANKLK